MSKIFDMLGLKWRLMIWPNGKDEEHLYDVCIGTKVVEGLDDGVTLSLRVYFEVLALNKRYITTGIFNTDGRMEIDGETAELRPMTYGNFMKIARSELVWN